MKKQIIRLCGFLGIPQPEYSGETKTFYFNNAFQYRKEIEVLLDILKEKEINMKYELTNESSFKRDSNIRSKGEKLWEEKKKLEGKQQMARGYVYIPGLYEIEKILV